MTSRTLTVIDSRPPTRSSRRSCRNRSSLACKRQRHVADFVQEERAVVGQLELAVGPLDRAGEGALFVAEKFAFQQIFRDRGAIDRDERLGIAGRKPVQRPRQNFLARPVSPINSTLTSIGPTRSRTCAIWAIFSEPKTSPSVARADCSRSCLFSSSSSCIRMARSMMIFRTSLSSGLAMKSKAPLAIARTALARSTLPLATMTLVCGAKFKISSSALRPSLALFSSGGRPRSSTTAWYGLAADILSNASARLPATSTT